MGFQAVEADYAQRQISLDEEIIKHPAATDFFRVESDTMISAFIPRGALLVVDRSLIPQNMNIVVAVVNGELMARYLRKNDVKSWLVPANSKVKEIQILPEMNVQILGVVISIITDPKEVCHLFAGR